MVTPEFREQIRLAAAAEDAKAKRPSKKCQKEWEKFARKLDSYLKRTFADSEEKPVRLVLKSYLRGMWEEGDDVAPLQDVLERHVDDLVAVSEINDVFGLLENQTKQTPYAYVNSWWAYNEVAKAMNFSMFLAEAQEIGYKRGKKNREQPRPNNLFRISDASNPYFSILKDDAGTLLGELRKHVRSVQQ